MYYGSPFYILMILLLISVCVLLWFLIKKLTPRMQKLVVLSIMILNSLQHLFKWAIYPIYEGHGFTAISTAYNVCALLILIMPIAFISRSQALRDFVFLAGAFAGFITNIVPYWHIGIPVSELGWEYARFYICHSLLFYSGILPYLLGMHRSNYKSAIYVGIGFLCSVAVILINNTVCIAMGIYYPFTLDNLYDALYTMNPAMCMHPSDSFPWLMEIMEGMTPDVFLPAGSGVYVPILWYAIPTFIGFSILVLAVVACVRNRRRFFKLKDLITCRFSKR